MSTKTIAVIDVGTLKTKFEIRKYDLDAKLSETVYKDKKLTVMGRDLDKTDNMILDKSRDLVIDALLEFKKKMQEFEVVKFKAITTEAIRRAKNSKDIISTILDKTQIQLETLTHEEEAGLYFSSISKHFPNQVICVTDIGGGSVQVVIGKDNVIYEQHLYKTGTYYLQEGFSKTHFPSAEEVNNAFDYVKQELCSLKTSQYRPDFLVYGSINIIDFFEAMNLELTKRDDVTHPYQVALSTLHTLYEKLIKLSYEDRMPLYPAEPYYMWGADKALMNIFAICDYLDIQNVIPTNNNTSIGLMDSLL